MACNLEDLGLNLIVVCSIFDLNLKLLLGPNAERNIERKKGACRVSNFQKRRAPSNRVMSGARRAFIRLQQDRTGCSDTHRNVFLYEMTSLGCREKKKEEAGARVSKQARVMWSC